MVAPAVRWVTGQSVRARSYPEKAGLFPLQILPSGMYPRLRPSEFEFRTPNQLYSELSPLMATAAWQAGLRGTMLPWGVRPSRQQRYVRLPGIIRAP